MRAYRRATPSGDALADAALDMQVRRDGDCLRFGYPVAVLATHRD